MNRRLPRTDAPVRLHVYLPQSLVMKMNLLLWDPKTNRPLHGARNRIVEAAIRDWLSAHDSPPTQEISHDPNPLG
jgi:hypothetical protein